MDRRHEIEYLRTADLIPYARNSRTHSESQIEAIVRSIQKFGFTNPVLIRDDRTIIAGHGRVMAAQRLGMEHVPCVRLSHLTDDEVRAYVIADNKLAELAGWDDELLAAELRDLQAMDFDLSLTGFDAAGIAEILADPSGDPDADAEPQVDRAGDLRNEWKTAAGQLWRCGVHRLLCGDSTRSVDVSRLMDGAAINVCFTSPPYASQRKYDESSGFKPIPPDDYVRWWEPIQANVAKHLATDGSMFVNIKASAEGLDTHLYVHDLVIAHVRQWGWHFATEFCWERNGIPKSVTRRFKNQFEPIFQFVRNEWKMRPDAVRHESSCVPKARGKGAGNTSWGEHQCGSVNMSGHQGEKGFQWFGDNIEAGMAYPGNRLPTFSGSHEAFGHAAAFPVGLPSFFVKAYTDESDNVYEPFSGSGSTLIACEQLGRQCYGMEISPAYVAVVLQRFHDATGEMPVLESSS